MPVTKSAGKKLRQDKKRTKHNESVKKTAMTLIKKARKNPTFESVKKAISATDKAVKKQVFHKNKAARIKSSLSKLVKPVAKKTSAPSKTKAKKP